MEASTAMNREPDEEAALAIRLATLCSELHVLPRAGGVLDQDPYELDLLEAGLYGLHKAQQRARTSPERRRGQKH